MKEHLQIRSGRFPRCYAEVAAAILALHLGMNPADAQLTRVSAVGKAAGTDVKASDEALKDAKRKAVEQACGVFINAQSDVADFQLIKDRILADVTGYIVEYKPTKEWKDGDITHVEILATVSTAKFEDAWAHFAQLKEDVGNPRCMIVITEDNDTSDLKDPKYNGICQSKLEAFFLSKDVELVDKNVSQDVKDRDVELAALGNDVNTLAAVAAKFSADVLVFGNAEATPGGATSVGGRTVYRWDIVLNVRVVQADSAKLLHSDSYRPEKPYLTSSAACGDDAFAKLATEVAPRVLADVAEKWRKRATSYNIFELRLSNCTRNDFRNVLTPELLKLRGVQQGAEGVKLRELVNEVATIEIYWSFDLNMLGDALSDLAMPGMAIEIKEQSGNRLVAELKKGG